MTYDSAKVSNPPAIYNKYRAHKFQPFAAFAYICLMTFAEKVYDAVKRIPKGRVATYGQIAEIIGSPGASRAVGNALHVNPYAPAVPCHRVVAADGRLAANFGGGGAGVQFGRLQPEGVSFLDDQCDIPRVDLSRCGVVIESHPLEPFLPPEGRILFLGSFPPPKARWSMEFFYPNRNNDFWRIQGLLHFGDARHFESSDGKRFDRDRIVGFCREQGLAFFDTAVKVCRWKGNASDEFLEILEPADLAGMLSRMPLCGTVVTTGGKASEELLGIMNALGSGLTTVPQVGAYIDLTVSTRQVRWWRMPSSSRAYPMSLAAKAGLYSRLF